MLMENLSDKSRSKTLLKENKLPRTGKFLLLSSMTNKTTRKSRFL